MTTEHAPYRAVAVPEELWPKLPLAQRRVLKVMRAAGAVELTVGDSVGEELKHPQRAVTRLLSVMARFPGGERAACFWRRANPEAKWTSDTGWWQDASGAIRVLTAGEVERMVKDGTQ